MTRSAKQLVVLVALLQGLLLYLADVGYDHGWWPFAALSGRICWYALVLAVPSVLLLSIRRLADRRLWQHMVGVLVVVSLLSWWVAFSAGGVPDLNSSSVLIPFGTTLSLGWLVLLPFLQVRQQHERWVTPYPDLFEHAWQNALALTLASLFVGLSWGVLWLWAALFKMIGVNIFSDLFRLTSFEYLATGVMIGLGILIARTQERTLHTARNLLLAIFKLLLPLLALVLVLFVITLPLTGLGKLSASFSAAGLLMTMLVLMPLVVIALVVLGNSPTLDVQRISVNSQLARLADGRVSATDFDLKMLRKDSGPQGYQALLQLADGKPAQDNPAFAKRIRQTIEHGGQHQFFTTHQRESQTISVPASYAITSK